MGLERLSRRRLLLGAAAVPAVGLTARATRRLAAAAPALRPGARAATSAACCAQCGARDHTMLADGCPAAPRVVPA